MRRHLIATAALILASAGGFYAATASAQSPAPRTSVGISIDGPPNTATTINCVGDGKHRTVNGDGTLFMENRTPHTMLCFIDIRRAGTPA